MLLNVFVYKNPPNQSKHVSHWAINTGMRTAQTSNSASGMAIRWMVYLVVYIMINVDPPMGKK